MPEPGPCVTWPDCLRSRPSLADSALVMIDLQNTYTRGVMELEDVQSALDQAAELLDRATRPCGAR